MNNQDDNVIVASDFNVIDSDFNVEELSLEEEIKHIFRNDPLYQVIEEEGLEDKLIPITLLSEMNRKNQYTISEAAERLNKKDYQIRNIIQRNGLEEYVQITQAGKLYRLDYRGIYRLYLIFLLQDQLNKRPVDIASLVGVMPETGREDLSKDRPNNRKGIATNSQTTPKVSEQLNGIEKHIEGMENQMLSMFLYMQMTREYDYRRKVYENAVSKVDSWEKEMNNINHLIELNESLLQISKEEKKEIQDLLQNVSDVVGNVNQTFDEVAKSQLDLYKRVQEEGRENIGFLAKIFGKKKPSTEELNIKYKAISVNAIEPKNELAIKREELDKLKEEREKLEKQKEIVHKQKGKSKADLEEFKHKMDQEKTRLINETQNQSIRLLLEQDSLTREFNIKDDE
ncbi:MULTISPECIES: hypothetical protein [Metabacillus]|uniref:hypothetical protein n=1 Tax=Metabacillus TaxID=2675233 RepID=UPI000C80BD66|nr:MULTISPECIES: hypothetical protein [Metabacillus]MCM3443593.1 hypothetical protein [Metabacillus halosaccharovorans]PMC34247.1 hypothetical protein CJ195_24325 [Bacillus sp. UMB0899]